MPGKLYNIGHISSNKVSGGTITFTQFAGITDATAAQLEILTNNSDAAGLHTHTGLSAAPGGGLVSNIGANDEWGISGIAWISSSKIYSPQYVGVWQGDVIGDTYIANDITLDNLTQITTKSHTVLSDIGTLTHANIDTQFTAWGGSGQKIKSTYDWFNTSSQKLSVIEFSGGKYTDVYGWYITNNAQFGNWLASGEKLSTLYTWYGIGVSSQQYPNWLASGGKLSTWFSESSGKLAGVSTHMSDTSIHSYAPSTAARYGWASIADAGVIAHGLGVKPSYVGISPSGASPIVYSFVVDATNITVYHTSPDAEMFSWQVKTVPVTVA